MIWDFQDALSRRLLLWSAVSIAAGVILLLAGDAFCRGFGLQAVVWGAIDAGIALFGRRGSEKRQASARPGPETTQREGRHLRRLLWINTGLDVLYVMVGLGLVYTLGGRNPSLAGTGWGIVLQGGFLFLFDLLHARAVPMTEPSMPATKLFGDPQHLPFLMAGERPAALLVHGFGGTPAEMRSLGESLNRDGWTARGILLPGFGADIATLVARRYGEWVAAVEAAAAELRQAGHRPLLLVGFSMGAAVSLAAATAVRPDGLVLLAPFWWEERPGWRLAEFLVRPFLPLSFRPLRKADFNDARLRQGIDNFMGGVSLDDPQTQQALRDLRVPLSLIDQVRGVSGAAYAATAQIEAPVLVVQGKNDPVVRIPQTRRLMRRMHSTSSYVEVDAGHDLTLPENAAWPQVEGAVADFARNVGELHSNQKPRRGKRSA
jgi:esterase/lipase